MSNRVIVTQYLCEQRHCILAAAWQEGGTDNPQNVEQRIADVVTKMKLNHWCGLCGSTQWHFEHGVTKFPTLAEAMPSLKASEALQDLTRQFFGNRPKPN